MSSEKYTDELGDKNIREDTPGFGPTCEKHLAIVGIQTVLHGIMKMNEIFKLAKNNRLQAYREYKKFITYEADIELPYCFLKSSFEHLAGRRDLYLLKHPEAKTEPIETMKNFNEGLLEKKLVDWKTISENVAYSLSTIKIETVKQTIDRYIIQAACPSCGLEIFMKAVTSAFSKATREETTEAYAEFLRVHHLMASQLRVVPDLTVHKQDELLMEDATFAAKTSTSATGHTTDGDNKEKETEDLSKNLEKFGLESEEAEQTDGISLQVVPDQTAASSSVQQ